MEKYRIAKEAIRYEKTHPSPILVKTVMGKGLSERAILPVTETEPDVIGAYIQTSFVHGMGTVRTI